MANYEKPSIYLSVMEEDVICTSAINSTDPAGADLQWKGEGEIA